MSDREESTISWIFKTLIIPLSFPMLMYRLYQYIKIKQFREKLPGKVVLITGCSGGLGEALAHTFYIAGCKVILAARRTEELKRVKKDLLELHSVKINLKLQCYEVLFNLILCLIDHNHSSTRYLRTRLVRFE